MERRAESEGNAICSTFLPHVTPVSLQSDMTPLDYAVKYQSDAAAALLRADPRVAAALAAEAEGSGRISSTVMPPPAE